MVRNPKLLALLFSLFLTATPQVAVAQTSIEQLSQQGTAAQTANKYSEAEAIWRRVLQIDPKNANAYVGLGKALESQGKYDQAFAAFQKAIQLDPKNANAYGGLVRALGDQGKYDQALAAFQKAIQLDPKNAYAYGGLGYVLGKQGKYDEVIAAFQKAIQLDPKYVNAYYNLGYVLGKQGKYDEAIAAFQKAIQLDPKNVYAYGGLGNSLASQGKYDEALAAFQKAIQLDPINANAYGGLGYALGTQGKHDEAMAAFQKAIQLDPKNAAAYNGLGNALYDQKKLDEAIAAYQKAIQIDPKYAGAYNGLGNALYDQKKLDEAIAAYQKAIQIDPKYAVAYNNLGHMLYDQKKLDEAIANFHQALSLPDDKSGTPTTTHTWAHNALGLVLQKQGKLKEAIQEFKQAITLDPNFVTTQNNLKEAQRLLALQQKPHPPIVDDQKWLPSPQEEPLVGVLRSVVRIIAEIPTGSNIAAGWVVKREGNKAWIVTNRHVVTDAKGTGRTSKKIELEFFSQPPAGIFPPRYTAKILQITDANDPLDLALLEVTDIPPDIQPLPMYSGKVGRTTQVRVIGHPSNGGDWTTVSGEISNVLSQENKLQITATLAEGNSGGPVIDKEKQQVVGLIVAILDPNQQRQDATKTSQPELSTPATGGFGFAYNMDVVIKKLRNWGIP